ncbi:MAG: MATE family efflux transporter [Pseudomonadota bacterium]
MAERDLTEGSLGAHLASMVGPAALGMLFTTLYNIVDTYYAGWVSTDAQAGLAVSFTGFMVFMALGFGLSSGASALIGAALGGGRAADARAFAAQALVLAAALGLLLGGAGALSSNAVLRLIGASDGVLETADSYLTLLFLGLPSFLIGFTANGVLTSQGDTASNRNAQIVAFFANVGLNPILIYGALGVPGLGFDGIALSTVLIQTAVAFFLVRRALATRALGGASLADARPTGAVLADLFRQGAPSSLTMLVMMVGATIMQVHLQPFGAAAVAGFGVAFRVEQLILLPILSISFSLMPLIAQNFGSGDHDRVRQALTLAAVLAIGVALLGAVALGVFGEAMTGVFTDDEAAIAAGAAYLRMAAFMMPAYTAMFIVTALFQGLRRPVWSVVIGLYRQIFALSLFPWVFVSFLDWGLSGVWMGLFVAVWSGFALAMALAVVIGSKALGGIAPDFAACRRD